MRDILSKWCDNAVKSIQYPPDRQAVHAELLAHLEDHRDALMAQGMDIRDATREALRAMGNAQEIEPQLASLHKPFWGVAYNMVQALLCLALIPILFVTLWQGYRFATENYNQVNDLAAPYGPYASDNSYLQNLQFFTKPGDWFIGNGYLVTFSQATCWDDRLYITVKVNSLIPMCDKPDFCFAMTLRDDQGRILPKSSTVLQTGPLSWVCHIQVSDFDPEATDYLELRYDRDGRDVSMIAEVPGGDMP